MSFEHCQQKKQKLEKKAWLNSHVEIDFLLQSIKKGINYLFDSIYAVPHAVNFTD